MVAAPTSTRAARTHLDILEAARRLLEERGFHGVGLESVATAAGVSRQSIYVHFGSKAKLLLALVAHVDEREGLPDLADAVERAPSAVEALDRFVDLVATLTPRVYRIAAVLDSARHDAPEAEAAWSDRMTRRRRRCGQIASRLADEGRLARGWSRDEAADFLWATTGLRVWEDLVVHRGWSSARFRRHLRRVLWQALVAEDVRLDVRPYPTTAASSARGRARPV
jgi:AcrR family transcriptional regulator